MAKTFYVSPGRSYTVTASEGTTITYPGIATPAATVGSEGSVTFNCTGTEITVSDDNAKIAQNFNNAGAAVAGAGEGSGGASLEGVALLEGGNSFSGDQNIEGDVVIEGSVTISGDVTAEGEYNGAEVIETQDTTIIPEAGKYYKYTGTGDTITVAAPVWNGYMTIFYLETSEPIELQGVTWSPAKPSLTGAGPFVYTLVCAESGKVLASAMNYSVATAEAIQAVMPVAWYDSGTARAKAYGAIAFGKASYASTNASAFGYGAEAFTNAIAIGFNAKTLNGTYHEIVIGQEATAINHCTITLGSNFGENVDGSVTWYKTRTEGTGSITIGAGANTLNNGDTESSNSITIGCKASNSGADSVVIGAGGKNIGIGSIAIGSAVTAQSSQSVVVGNEGYVSVASVAIGSRARAHQYGVAFGTNSSSLDFGVAIGAAATAKKENIALGSYANADAQKTIAIGYNATVSDYGATVIRSTAEDGTYTQLYFSGANTPLANTYHDGAPMLGYVTKDSAGNIVAAGTRSLIDLLTDNSTFAPASLDENGEWVAPTVFHPSDLDLPPQEEPSEEEYTPMPVYPIVEPEIPLEPSEEQ